MRTRKTPYHLSKGVRNQSDINFNVNGLRNNKVNTKLNVSTQPEDYMLDRSKRGKKPKASQ